MVLNRDLISICLFSACILVIPVTSRAGDWAQWGGTNNRNMVSKEKGLPDDFEADKEKALRQGAEKARNVKWVVRLGAFAYGNPTAVGGKVFAGTNVQTLSDDSRFKFKKGGLVKCLDAATGALVWQLPVPERHNLPAGAHFGQQHLGICSSPTVDGERVYVVTGAGDVVCLDINGQRNGNAGPFTDEASYMAGVNNQAIELSETDADIIWRFDPIDELGVCPHDVASCSALIVGDVLYVGTSNGVDRPHEKVVKPLAPSLIALDKRTGALLAVDDEKIGTRLFHAQWSSPSAGQVNGRMLIFFGGGDGVCYAFEALDEIPKEPAKLKKVWSFDCNPAKYKFRDGKPIPYYSGDKRKGKSPNKNDGNYVGPSQIIATPVFHDGRIYVAIGQDPAHGRGRGMMHCIDATKTGDITESGSIWSYDGLDRSMGTAAVADGLVYVTDVGGRLHCLDADTGRPCWVYETKKETWGGPLVADGKLYFGNQKNLYILTAGRKLQLLHTVRMSAPVCSTPIAADGVLYVSSNRYLWAASLMP